MSAPSALLACNGLLKTTYASPVERPMQIGNDRVLHYSTVSNEVWQLIALLLYGLQLMQCSPHHRVCTGIPPPMSILQKNGEFLPEWRYTAVLAVCTRETLRQDLLLPPSSSRNAAERNMLILCYSLSMCKPNVPHNALACLLVCCW